MIERRLGEALARYLPRLDAGTLKDLDERLGALPVGGSLVTGVREEQILETGWYVRKVKEAKDHEAVLAVLSQLWGSREEGRILLEECGGIAAGVVKYTEELRSWYPQLAEQMELPLDQFEKEQERAAIKLAANPINPSGRGSRACWSGCPCCTFSALGRSCGCSDTHLHQRSRSQPFGWFYGPLGFCP